MNRLTVNIIEHDGAFQVNVLQPTGVSGVLVRSSTEFQDEFNARAFYQDRCIFHGGES